MYTMNIRNFRSNLSKHLDDADQGAHILIERGASMYELVRVGAVPREAIRVETIIEPDAVATPPDPRPVIPQLEVGEKRFKEIISDLPMCKNNHALAPGRDRCMTPGCKYSVYS